MYTNLVLISVYVNPEFVSFEEAETFRPYWPFNEEFISMTVNVNCVFLFCVGFV